MIHYSCDRCKRSIDPKNDLRYVVKFEVHAMMDAFETDDADEDRDHLLEIHEILERADDAECDLIGDDIYRRHRHDLCNDCYRKFVKNPVGAEQLAQLNFSQN